MGIRTPDLLHAMKPGHIRSPVSIRRDQRKDRWRATPGDAEQRPQTPICYPTRYPQSRAIEPPPRAEAIRWARPGSSATLRGRDAHTGRATSQPVTQTAHRGHSTRGLTRPNLPELRALTLRISMRILDGSFDGGSVGPMGSWCCRTARVRFASVQPYVPIRPASGNVVM